MNPMRTVLWSFFGIVVLLILAIVALWLARLQLAEVYLQRWCQDRSVRCEANITDVGLNTVSARSLRVDTGTRQPLEIASITAD